MRKLLLIVTVLTAGIVLPMQIHAQAKSQFAQRYMGLVEVGGGMGVGDWGANRVSLTMVNGYKIIPQFAVGVGVGAQMFIYRKYDARKVEMTLPMFLHLRSDFIEGNVSPFIALNVGYNMSLSGSETIKTDGLMVEPTIGVSFNVSPKNRMTAGLSFAMNSVKYYHYDSWN